MGQQTGRSRYHNGYQLDTGIQLDGSEMGRKYRARAREKDLHLECFGYFIRQRCVTRMHVT